MKHAKATRATKAQPPRLSCPDCGAVLASKYEAKQHAARLLHRKARPIRREA